MILRAEPEHEESLQLYDVAWRKITHSYVLVEFIALAEARGIPRDEALSFVSNIQDSTEVDLVWVGETLHRQGVSFLGERLDKSYSLCDAVSFLVMRQERITEALTTDHHFEQEGLVRLLRS